MTWNGSLPFDIATSMAIYFGEQLQGEFHNSFITFSSSPKLVVFPEGNLRLKAKFVDKYRDCSNTNITKVYDLILSMVKRPDFKKEDMIDRIVIISDMEFDKGTENVPSFETFKAKFEELGFEMPQVAFWNVSARVVHFAALPNKNITLVSGASRSVIDSILLGKNLDPYQLMIKTLKPFSFIDEVILSQKG